jgi:hypothetical protein
MLRDEGRSGRFHRWQVAHVARVALGRDPEGRLQGLQEVAAPRDEADGGAARGVVPRERLTDAAGGAGEEDFQLGLPLRDMPISWSTITKT